MCQCLPKESWTLKFYIDLLDIQRSTINATVQSGLEGKIRNVLSRASDVKITGIAAVSYGKQPTSSGQGRRRAAALNSVQLTVEVTALTVQGFLTGDAAAIEAQVLGNQAAATRAGLLLAFTSLTPLKDLTTLVVSTSAVSNGDDTGGSSGNTGKSSGGVDSAVLGAVAGVLGGIILILLIVILLMYRRDKVHCGRVTL